MPRPSARACLRAEINALLLPFHSEPWVGRAGRCCCLPLPPARLSSRGEFGQRWPAEPAEPRGLPRAAPGLRHVLPVRSQVDDNHSRVVSEPAAGEGDVDELGAGGLGVAAPEGGDGRLIRHGIPDAVGGEDDAGGGRWHADVLVEGVREDAGADVRVADGPGEAEAARPHAHGPAAGLVPLHGPPAVAGEAVDGGARGLDPLALGGAVLHAEVVRELVGGGAVEEEGSGVANGPDVDVPPVLDEEAQGAAGEGVALDAAGVEDDKRLAERLADRNLCGEVLVELSREQFVEHIGND